MSKIRRDDFLAQNANRNIDLAKAGQDTALRAELAENGISLTKLRQADRNADGLVDAREAWKLADDFDSDGTRRSLDATHVTADGRIAPTAAGRASTVLGMMLQQDELQGEPTVQPPSGGNDDILFVGMGTETRYSAGAKHEIKKLRERGANVVGITDSRYGDDHIKAGGRVHNLADAAGRESFVATLGLPGEQSEKIADIIARTDADGRDELGQMIQVWAKAEKGGEIPSRMVLSGHHVGSEVWGDGNGSISWDIMKDLSQAMPQAAGQVEDLHLSACYSGGESNRAKFKEMFPNVKTIWGYSGSAPGTGSGATIHQASWERATRGDGTVEAAMENLQRRGIRKADNIDAATVTNGTTVDMTALDGMRDTLQSQDAVYEAFFTGEQSVENSQRGPLREYYNDIQAMLQHPGITGEERTQLEARRDQAIRTLFYDSHIKHRFSDAYGEILNVGYDVAGLEVPDYEHMSRGEAMNAISNFREHVEQNPDLGDEARHTLQLLNGLWNLDSNTIPVTWI